MCILKMQCIVSLLKSRPVTVSLISNTCKTLIADVVAQKIIERKQKLDKRRTAIFTTFGLVYLGGWQHFLFNKLFTRFEHMMRMANVSQCNQSMLLTFLDLGIHTPFVYFPAFYTIKCVAEDKKIDDLKIMYKTNIHNDLIAIWKIWIPAQIVNFMCLPLHLRMPYITCVSFVWTMMLSLMHGNNI